MVIPLMEEQLPQVALLQVPVLLSVQHQVPVAFQVPVLLLALLQVPVLPVQLVRLLRLYKERRNKWLIGIQQNGQ